MEEKAPYRLSLCILQHSSFLIILHSHFTGAVVGGAACGVVLGVLGVVGAGAGFSFLHPTKATTTTEAANHLLIMNPSGLMAVRVVEAQRYARAPLAGRVIVC